MLEIKTPTILATSTHEAELIAMNLAAQKALRLRNFLVEIKAVTNRSVEELMDDTPEADIHFSDLDATKLLCDNLKHIDIRYWKIREYQEQQRLTVKHV